MSEIQIISVKEHGRSESEKLGFPMLYLSTSHVGYYEKYGWRFVGHGYDVGGDATRIYEAETINDEKTR